MKKNSIARVVVALAACVTFAGGIAIAAQSTHAGVQPAAYAAEQTTTTNPADGKSSAGKTADTVFSDVSLSPNQNQFFSRDDDQANAYFVGQNATITLKSKLLANIDKLYYYSAAQGASTPSGNKTQYTEAQTQRRNFSFTLTQGSFATADMHVLALYKDGRYDDFALRDVTHTNANIPAHIITSTNGAQLIVTYEDKSTQKIDLNQKETQPIHGKVSKVELYMPDMAQRVEAAKDAIAHRSDLESIPVFDVTVQGENSKRGFIATSTSVDPAKNLLDISDLAQDFNSSNDAVTLNPVDGFNPVRGALTAVDGSEDKAMVLKTFAQAGQMSIKSVSFEGIDLNHSTSTWFETDKHLLATTRHIKFKVTAESTQPADANGNKPSLPAGTQLKVNYPDVYFPFEDSHKLASKTYTVASDGTVTFDLPEEGVYQIDKLTLTYHDANGDLKTSPIMDFVDSADQFKKDNLQEVVWMKSPNTIDADPVVTIANDNNDEDTAPFHKKDVKFRITIKDRWLPYFQYTNASEMASVLEISLNGKKIDTKPLTFSGKPWDFSHGAPTFTTDALSLGEYTNHKGKPAEGTYSISVNYKGRVGKSQPVLIDYTAPQAGKVSVSTIDKDAAKPQDKVDQTNKDKWKVSSAPLRVTISDIQDKGGMSGIDTDELALVHADSSPYEGYTLDKSADGHTVSFDINDTNGDVPLDDIYLKLVDRAGNERHDLSLAQLAQGDNDIEGYKGILVDTSAPQLSVTYDNNDVRNEKYYKAHRHATISITENNFELLQHFSPDEVIVTTELDGAAHASVKLSDFTQQSGTNVWTAAVDADSDGNWTVNAAFKDAAGNAASAVHDEFVVDTVAPVLSVSFDNNNVINGKYFNASRVATITETERNFSTADTHVTTTWAMNSQSGTVAGPAAGNWSEGQNYVYTTSVSFSADGRYTMTVTATDLAGNSATQSIEVGEFVIDTTKPTIDFANIQDKTAYNGKVAPIILFNDTNFDASKTTFTLKGTRHDNVSGVTSSADTLTVESRQVTFADFKHEVEADDVYTLTARMTDDANNVTEKSITFSVNRFGSTYALSPETSDLRGKFVKKTGNIVVDEINVSGLDTDKTKVVVAHDSDSKVLNTAEYSQVGSDDKGWSRTRYTIPARNFTEDGYYRVIVSSVDKAGNVSENTMEKKDESRTKPVSINFAVDSTKPTASVIGAQAHTVFYSADGRTITVQAQDNLKLRTATLRVDGKVVGEWIGDELAQAPARYTLPSDAKDHDIVLTAVDEAGNETTASYDDMVVASTWWQYMREHAMLTLLIMLGSVILLAVMILIAIALVVRHRRTQYRRNPFNR